MDWAVGWDRTTDGLLRLHFLIFRVNLQGGEVNKNCNDRFIFVIVWRLTKSKSGPFLQSFSPLSWIAGVTFHSCEESTQLGKIGRVFELFQASERKLIPNGEKTQGVTEWSISKYLQDLIVNRFVSIDAEVNEAGEVGRFRDGFD